jgi:G-patch domain
MAAMGFIAGRGLGKSGAGIAAPIQVNTTIVLPVIAVVVLRLIPSRAVGRMLLADWLRSSGTTARRCICWARLTAWRVTEQEHSVSGFTRCQLTVSQLLCLVTMPCRSTASCQQFRRGQVTALRPGAGLGLVHSMAAEGATAAKKQRRGGRKARLRKHAEAQRADRHAARVHCLVHSAAHVCAACTV